MSAGSNLRSEKQFQCSICLDVFTDPVSIPCGHNFCKTCITQHWDGGNLYKCPLCKELFYSRPQLRVNTFIREMVDQFRREAEQETSSSSKQQAAKPGEVPCDVCSGTRLKALKSCLVCLLSYCETHLEPHLTASRLRKHQLVDPVENLEDKMCLKHDKPLELFCRTDQTCVCLLCSVLDHKTHEFVPLREEYEGKKAELEKTEAEVQQMIHNRRLKIQEIKESLKISQDAADRQRAEGVQVFTALKEYVERSLKELLKKIQDKQKTTEKQAEDFIKDLEQEIIELMKRRSEVKQLSRSEDHLHLLQSFMSLKAAPPTKDWTEVRVHPPSYEETVMRAVSQLEENLRRKMKMFQLKKVQQFAVDVTLDPDTANPHLILSDDGKQVNLGDVRKKLPNNPERFSDCVSVLGKQSFSSGRFYFEVQVKGKTKLTLGVARESINRKGIITLNPRNGYWTVCLRNGNKYEANAEPPVRLRLGSGPEKVGVFVDYEEGLVSFYDVEAAALIYSFTGCCFTQKLLPYFSPCNDDGGKNAAPLTVVRAVSQLEENLRKKMKMLELKKVQQFAVDVTLDPDTAHPDLILSDDGKQVHDSDERKNLPNNPERFSYCVCVLGKQSFSSGRFYFEVQVKGKTEWDLGVVRESINRKGGIIMSPEDGYWTVRLRNGNEYEAAADPSVRLHLGSGPEKVGVFVDYEEGLVSFYDVEAAALIYSFTGCCFTQKLLPFFCPCPNDGGKNSAPLIICSVNQLV